MSDWVDGKAREIIEAAARNKSRRTIWGYCKTCDDWLEFSGGACKKCGTKR